MVAGQDDEPNLEKLLNGLNENRDHHYLINEANAQDRSVFAVDGIGIRDDYMAKNMTTTIQNEQCEKGISVNGHLHLSCTKAYPYKYCRDSGNMSPALDKKLRTKLKNIGLAKSIEILRIYTPLVWSD